MAGNEVATIWMSRIAMNMPRHMAMKPIHAARGGTGDAVEADWIIIAGGALRVTLQEPPAGSCRSIALRTSCAAYSSRHRTVWNRMVSAIRPGPNDMAQPAALLSEERSIASRTNITVAEDMLP